MNHEPTSYTVGHCQVYYPMAAGVPMTEAEQLWKAYQKLGSVHRVGPLFGVHGQTVKARLNKAGYKLNNAKWTEGEISRVREYYSNTEYSAFSIADLANELKRSWSAVALKASRIGVSDKRTGPKKFSDRHKKAMSATQKQRATKIGGEAVAAPLLKWVQNYGNSFKGMTHTVSYKEMTSKRFKEWYRLNPHPKGMLGKSHTQETRQLLSKLLMGREVPAEQTMKALKTKMKKYGTIAPGWGRPKTTWKGGWREVAGNRIYFRSRWEYNYACYLQSQVVSGAISKWEHEPETFWFEGIKRGCVSYLPDFRVTFPDGKVEYHEVKGWMDPRSITKLKRMAKYHPAIALKVIDGKWFKANEIAMSSTIHGWEVKS